MAAPLAPLIPRPDLVAIRVPGDGRTRVLGCRMVVETGTWLAIPGPWGDEPSVVVAPPGMVEASAEFVPWAEVLRLLPAEDVPAVLEQVARAPELIDAACHLTAESFPGVTIRGWRFTLAGEAVCSLSAAEGAVPVGFAERLAELSGCPVHLESGDAAAPLYGGLGRLRPNPTAPTHTLRDDGLRRRLASLSSVPRLGSTVLFPSGRGVLLGVSVRHREARLRLPDGQEIAIPLDQTRET